MAIGTWTQRTSGTTAALNAVAYGGPTGSEKHVVVGNGALLYSSDGTTWTAATLPDSLAQYRDVLWSPTCGRFVAVGLNGSDGAAATSTDGVTWSASVVHPLAPCHAVAENGGVFITAARASGEVARSLDGIVWATVLTGSQATFQAVCATPSAFILGGTLGEIARSHDGGLTWKTRNSGTTVGIVSIAHSPLLGMVLAVSSDGSTVYSSNDGRTWNPGSSGVSGSLDRKTRWLSGDDGFFISGTSTTGRFDRRDTETSTVEAVSTGGATTTSCMNQVGSLLVAVAAGGEIWTAPI